MAWQVREKAEQTGTALNPTGPGSSSVPEGVKKLANERMQVLLRMRLSYQVRGSHLGLSPAGYSLYSRPRGSRRSSPLRPDEFRNCRRGGER